MNGRGDSDASINEPWQEGFPLSVTFVTYLNMIRRDDCVTSENDAVQELQFRIQVPFFEGGRRAGKRPQNVEVMLQDGCWEGRKTATERKGYDAR